MLLVPMRQDGRVNRIDVTILTWNDDSQATQAARSALLPPGDIGGLAGDVRVVVFDNGSEPRAEIALDGVRLERSQVNLGVAAGRNRAASFGDGELICFLDSDATLEPGCLARLASALLEYDSAAVAAPVFVGQAPEQSAGRAPGIMRKVARGLGAVDTYGPVDRQGDVWEVEFAIGACQMVRREVFEELGGFDETYFYGPEDVDLCLRVRQAGHKVIQVASARCNHEPRRHSRHLWSARGLRHGVALARHLWRHRGAPRLQRQPEP